ncbi:MAG: GNAT family N-acetyltransferase [Bdellovibrio sp.]
MLKELEKKPFEKILVGSRIRLVEAVPDLAVLLWGSIIRDRELRGESWEWCTSIGELKEYLSTCSCEDPVFEVVYIFEKDGRIFGTFHIHNLSYRNHKAEIGYAIEKSFEGNGYVAEAVMLVEMELKRLGFNKIVLTCDIENTRSMKVAERAGFLREGTLIKDCIEQGKYRDTAVFGKILSR